MENKTLVNLMHDLQIAISCLNDDIVDLKHNFSLTTIQIQKLEKRVDWCKDNIIMNQK